jgi:hypothetical protein
MIIEINRRIGEFEVRFGPEEVPAHGGTFGRIALTWTTHSVNYEDSSIRAFPLYMISSGKAQYSSANDQRIVLIHLLHLCEGISFLDLQVLSGDARIAALCFSKAFCSPLCLDYCVLGIYLFVGFLICSHLELDEQVENNVPSHDYTQLTLK